MNIICIKMKILTFITTILACLTVNVYAVFDAKYCVDYSDNDETLFFENGSDNTVLITIASKYRKDELIFKVTRFADEKVLRFKVVNPPTVLEPYYSYDRKEWKKFHAASCRSDGWAFSGDFTQAKVFIALVPEARTAHAARHDKLPYPYEKVAAYIDTIKNKPLIDSKIIGTSVEGRDIYKFTITNKAVPDDLKKHVWLNFRVHGDEATQSYVLEGTIEHLLKDTPEVKNLLDKMVFHIVPIINPDGAFADVRENSNGMDLNRNWSSPETTFVEEDEIAAVHGEINSLVTDDGKKIAHLIDFHGWNRAEDGGFRSHYNTGNPSTNATIPYTREQSCYIKHIKSLDKWQSYWEYSPGVVTMARLALYNQYGISAVTQEYPSTYRVDSTQVKAEDFREQGAMNLRAIYKFLFHIEFVNEDGDEVKEYLKDEKIYITLDDYDLGINKKSSPDKYNVTLFSASGDTETVLLTETGDTTGIFTVSEGISFEQNSIVKGDGLLQISATSETIGVIYHDSDYVDDVTWDYVKAYTSTTGKQAGQHKIDEGSIAITCVNNGLNNGTRYLQLTIPEKYTDSEMSLTIYTVNGKSIKTFNRKRLMGINIIPVNESSDGMLLSAGVYYCVLKAGRIMKPMPLIVW